LPETRWERVQMFTRRYGYEILPSTFVLLGGYLLYPDLLPSLPGPHHQLGRVAQARGTAPTSSLRPASLAGRPGSASAGVERLQCAPLHRHTACSCPNATCLPYGHATLTLAVGGCQSPLVGSSAITGLAVQHQLGTHAIR
jgi:hypothetical protein